MPQSNYLTTKTLGLSLDNKDNEESKSSIPVKINNDKKTRRMKGPGPNNMLSGLLKMLDGVSNKNKISKNIKESSHSSSEESSYSSDESDNCDELYFSDSEYDQVYTMVNNLINITGNLTTILKTLLHNKYGVKNG
jgi:hypothetical protein